MINRWSEMASEPMETDIQLEEKLLRRRKSYVQFIVILMMIIIIAFNMGSWFFLNKMESSLENELAKRLLSITALAADNIEITPGVRIDDIAFLTRDNYGDYLLIQGKLRSYQTHYELEGVYIIDAQSRVIIDASGNFPQGSKLSYLQQDSLELTRAWEGRVSVSPIHVVEGNRFKSGYAPITNIFAEVTAVLVLEVNADFFQIIHLFRRGLVLIGLASMAAIILFSIFLAWTINLLINTQKSLRKTEQLAILGQMSASVAHEIRNPLGIIKATADVIKLKYADESEPDELFEYIGAEVNRLNNLVNDFLSFARDLKLNVKKGDMAQTIQKAITAFKRDLQDKKISISFRSSLKGREFSYDEERVQQILYNLLVNAAQAIEKEGNIKVHLGLHQHKNKDFVQIAVEDDGCGIEGDLQKIFEPFYTTKSSGSGLGLAITKQIVEKHGGWVDIRSENAVGTTVTFFLPLN